MMRAHLLLTLLVALTLGACASAPVNNSQPDPQPQPQPEPEPSIEGGMPWLKDLAEAKKSAATGKKRLFIEFTGEGCVPCMKLEKKVWPDGKLAARVVRDYVPVQLWDDADRAAIGQYDIKVIPTFVIAEADGEMLLKHVGPPFMSPSDAIKWIDGIPDRLNELKLCEARARARPDDFAIQLGLFQACSDLGLVARADAALQAAETLAGDDAARLLEMDIARLRVLHARQQLRPAAEAAERVATGLLASRDERLVPLGLLVVEVRTFVGRYDKARELAREVNRLFPGNSHVIEYNLRAAFAAARSGDNTTAKAELEAIVAAGPEEDVGVATAKEMLAHMFK